MLLKRHGLSGKELEIFDKAKIFQKYVFLKIKKYFKDGIFEVGAG